MNDFDPSKAIRSQGEQDMSPEWQEQRDRLKDTITDTILDLEKAKQSGEEVKEGFAIVGEAIGRSRAGKLIMQRPSAPGVYMDVRQGATVEAGRVVVDEQGATVYVLRMPNFEIGHSSAKGPTVLHAGVEYGAAVYAFTPDGMVSSEVEIRRNGQAYQQTWSGEGSQSWPLSSVEQIQQAANWVSEDIAPHVHLQA